MVITGREAQRFNEETQMPSSAQDGLATAVSEKLLPRSSRVKVRSPGVTALDTEPFAALLNDVAPCKTLTPPKKLYEFQATVELQLVPSSGIEHDEAVIDPDGTVTVASAEAVPPGPVQVRV